MRFPNLTDLDQEQRRVYANAPNDGAILVVGAPGTGKTVMAFHRAQKLSELGQEPRVVIYNRVLAKYTSAREGLADDAKVTTMHSWVSSWWRKALGGRPPMLEGSKYDHDWMAMLRQVMERSNKDPGIASQLSWGHVIIDEGQDFSQDMYTMLGTILNLEIWQGVEVPPALTVFADDNQRLQAQQNSTTDQIAFQLALAEGDGRFFLLKRNFRNTQQVASLARYFQVGHRTGASELPSRSGPVPTAMFFKDTNSLAEFILRKCKISPGKQVGVIVPGTKRNVKTLHNRLKSKLVGEKYKVQAYINGNKELTSESLDFDAVNTVTIVHQASAKGLEFDIVFYAKLEDLNVDAGGGTTERMVLYVMCSRSRDELLLGFSDIDSGSAVPAALTLLPPLGSDVIEYRPDRGIENEVKRVLNSVAWARPEVDPG
jgi:DNA helicase II / ATP-dependent DNA helicase PcrA